MKAKDKERIDLVNRVVEQAMEYQLLYADRNAPDAPKTTSEELETMRERLEEYTGELLTELLGREATEDEVDQALRLEEP